MDAGTGPGTWSRRRGKLLLAALLVLVTLLVIAIAWLSRPPQVAGLVLRQAGNALGLDIRFDGAAEYRLRGVPHLMVRGLEARRPGSDVPLLTAHRAYLALPWSTLRARGADLTVERIELDSPTLDLQELQAWLATRPEGGSPRVPTLTSGLGITGGTVAGGDWSVRGIRLDVPFLAPGQPVRGHVGGELLLAGGTRLPFDLYATLAAPRRDAAVGMAGNATVVADSWSLPMQAVLSARLHAGDDGLGLDGMQLGMRARHLAPGREALRFSAGLAAPVRYLDGRLEIAPAALVLRGDGTVPDLRGRGGFSWQDGMALELEGHIAEWPPGWPRLPAPLADSTTALPFTLAYEGQADLSGPAGLRLEHGTARLDARFHLTAVLDWLEHQPDGTPLPPLQGRLSVPRLELPGATLHGVELEMPTGPDAP